MSDLTGLTLIQTIEGLKTKKFSKTELNRAYLTRIKEVDPKIKAYLHLNDKSDAIPAAIKDIISVRDLPMSGGSKILDDYVPQYDATVITKLMGNGASFIGKTNLDEFAMGSSGENSAYEPTKNPWDTSKVPGGSSSGSAAAVAADLCTFALGTDTGGSIRQPSSLSGVVGLKPSYGRVSRYGAQAMASSFDQIGPITKTVADARMILGWISGADGYDSNCMQEQLTVNPIKQVNGASSSQLTVKNKKIGVAKEYFAKGLDTGVEKVIKEAIKQLEKMGAEIVDVSLPHTDLAIAAYYVLITSEISANFSRYDGIRFGKDRGKFGAEVKRRIMLGTFALSTGYFDDYFIKAAKVRTLIKQDFEKAFAKCDAIAGPVSPTVAWKLGEKVEDPLAMYLSDVYTIPASLAGLPGLSVPCGFSDDLPVGLQLVGKYADENTLLSVGEAYELATDWHKQRPKI